MTISKVLSGDERWHVEAGDCRTVLATMADASVDSIVCDPPYELTSGKKGGSGPASVNLNSPAGRARVTTGFMGMAWDGSGIAYDVALWRDALRVLKPGGHLLAFGGTRTYHRMACAIEDAGFEIRDSLHWMYGTGFPKSLNLPGGLGTALKPAHEPIVVARKPLVGTVAGNVEAFGTGALNIDASRVAFTSAADEAESKQKNQHADFGSGPMTNQVFGKFSKDRDNYNPPGRWPPNVMLSHHWSCTLEPVVVCAECCPVAELDRQSGEGTSRKGKPRGSAKPGEGWGMTQTGAEYDDSGGASRFFPVFRYEAKASRRERGEGNIHPTVKPVAAMAWLVRLVTPPNGVVLDPFTGSGTTGVACLREGFRFIGCEREPQYVEIARARVAAAAEPPAQGSLLVGS